MTGIDWAIVAFGAAFAVLGYHQGLIVGAPTLAAFAGGAFLGGRLAPALLEGGAESPYAPLVALAGGLLVGLFVAVLVEGMAQAVRRRLIRSGGVAFADGFGGGAVFAALALGLAWVFGAVALNTPGFSEVRADVQRSEVLRRLNDVLPPTGPLLNVLNRVAPTPEVRGPDAPVEGPNPAIARDPDVRRAGASTVRVLGTACGLGIAGSGWVAAPGIVVTSAHVVAGEEDTTVTTRDGAGPFEATPVLYQPRNDLAILRVDGLEVEPLPIHPDPAPGIPGAALGFPENGPFALAPVRLGVTERVISNDSYGRGPIRRRMTSFRGRVRSGNSGGPVLDRAGRVLTTVFATSLGADRPSGLGVPNGIVSQALERASGTTHTGPCAA